MRNPKRITPLLFKLEMVWQKNPDWRLGQLISNLLGPGPHDVFYIEDDEWEKLIDTKLTKKQKLDVKQRFK